MCLRFTVFSTPDGFVGTLPGVNQDTSVPFKGLLGLRREVLGLCLLSKLPLRAGLEPHLCGAREGSSSEEEVGIDGNRASSLRWRLSLVSSCLPYRNCYSPLPDPGTR